VHPLATVSIFLFHEKAAIQYHSCVALTLKPLTPTTLLLRLKLTTEQVKHRQAAATDFANQPHVTWTTDTVDNEVSQKSADADGRD
jgi:hypothetical protein